MKEETRIKEGVTGHWAKVVKFSHDTSEIAKLVALIFLIIGFISVYLPGVRAWWEVNFQPRYWYYIGKVEQKMFSPFDYQNPIWNGGPMVSEKLEDLTGQVIITRTDAMHIGRSEPGGLGKVRVVQGKMVCLHVHRLDRRIETGKPEPAHVWAEASKVTC